MSLKRTIVLLSAFPLFWSCSSYVRYTSEDVGDTKTNGNTAYESSKKSIETIEDEIKVGNKSNQFEGKLITSSKKWLGTPYQYGGTSPSGVDCSGFVVNVYNDLGYKLPRTSSEQYQFARKVTSTQKNVGDLVFFRRGSDIGHVGIYVGSNKMIHASTSKGVIIQDLDNEYLQRTFAGFGRVKK